MSFPNTNQIYSEIYFLLSVNYHNSLFHRRHGIAEYYLSSCDNAIWLEGTIYNSLAINLLKYLDDEQLSIVKYSLKEGNAINIKVVFINQFLMNIKRSELNNTTI